LSHVEIIVKTMYLLANPTNHVRKGFFFYGEGLWGKKTFVFKKRISSELNVVLY